MIESGDNDRNGYDVRQVRRVEAVRSRLSRPSGFHARSLTVTHNVRIEFNRFLILKTGAVAEAPLRQREVKLMRLWIVFRCQVGSWRAAPLGAALSPELRYYSERVRSNMVN